MNVMEYGNFRVEMSDWEVENVTDSEEKALMHLFEQDIEPLTSTDASTVVGISESPHGGPSTSPTPINNVSAIQDLPPPETPAAPKRFKQTSNEDLDFLFDARQSSNTKRNTAWGVKIFQDWNMEVYGQTADLTIITPEDLASKLRKFYAEVRPKPKEKSQDPDDESREYHKNSLVNIRSAINRYLADNKRHIDVTKDKEFKTANGVLDGMLKERARQGKAKPTKHHEVMEVHDLTKISEYLKQAPHCPIILRQNVWYNLAIHFVMRGMEFHHKLRIDSFEFHTDETGEYVTIKSAPSQKNYQGGINSDEAPNDRRMYASGTESCPVKMLRLFLQKCDPESTSLFNQYKKSAVLRPTQETIWYTPKSLAKRTFSNFLPDICKAAKVSKQYTPHCLRTTAIQALNDDGFEARHIMYMSGHKNEGSLRSYNRRLSTVQKKSLSKSLSSVALPVEEQQIVAVLPNSSDTDLSVACENPSCVSVPNNCENATSSTSSVSNMPYNFAPSLVQHQTSNMARLGPYFSNVTFNNCNFHF